MIKSCNPALVKQAKSVMRTLDRLEMGGARRILKPLGVILYRPATEVDQELANLLKERLGDSIIYCNAQPEWRSR